MECLSQTQPEREDNTNIKYGKKDEISVLYSIFQVILLSIKYWKVKSLFWGCFCVKFPKSYLKGIVMLNSIMMSNAPLRPIFIFAISKQILPASQYSVQIIKERGKNYFFWTRRASLIEHQFIFIFSCLLENMEFSLKQNRLLCCWIKASFVCSHYLQVFWEV